MEDFEIIKAEKEDLPRILRIYARARDFMCETGKKDQWKGGFPPRELLENDIKEGDLYVVKERDVVHAVFAFIFGEDPTYAEIEGGWLSDAPYAVLHRVASDGETKGVFGKILAFCDRKTGHLRIDTHKDNKVMQHLILKNGFSECDIIHIADGSPRIAYERLND